MAPRYFSGRNRADNDIAVKDVISLATKMLLDLGTRVRQRGTFGQLFITNEYTRLFRR